PDAWITKVSQRERMSVARKKRTESQKISTQKVQSAVKEDGEKKTLLHRIKKGITFLDSKRAKDRQGVDFNHDTTGFILVGAHETIRCENCHVRGTFKGTPKRCDGCHSSSGRVAATIKPLSHIKSESPCDRCHSTGSWLSPVRMDHTAVAGSCSQCHNSRTATGKSTNHISSGNNCSDCHTTVSWASGRFDHGSVKGSCISCHNGRTATGKGRNHIVSSNICDDCHNTSSWGSARFDHGSVTGSCSSCHNGTTATGKSRNHISSSNICDDCHNTSSWGSARFDHGSVTGSCSSCHNGTTATGKGSGHFVTSVQCDECHSTSGWRSVGTYRHSSGSYPGNHNSGVSCKKCHTSNTQTATWTNSGYKPDCAGCHAGDYKQGPHKKVENPQIFYSVSELRNCAGACHVYTDSSMTTIQKSRNSKHRVSGGGF
ncbi:MAG: hypothetical protein ACE5GF_07665, partial [Thermodesulfobacteriota bacterium]